MASETGSTVDKKLNNYSDVQLSVCLFHQELTLVNISTCNTLVCSKLSMRKIADGTDISEPVISHVIFIFCGTGVTQNMNIT